MLVLLLLVWVVWLIADPKETGAPPPGQLVVEVVWPSEMNVDVDLWVNGPGEERPVGYSHRRGRIWNLLRDDLGRVRDELEVNMEHAYSRGVPDGLYTVNVHLYSIRDHVPPVPVRVTLGVARNDSMTDLLASTVQLKHRGHEQTVFSWQMQSGSFIPDSVEYIQRPMRGFNRGSM